MEGEREVRWIRQRLAIRQTAYAVAAVAVLASAITLVESQLGSDRAPARAIREGDEGAVVRDGEITSEARAGEMKLGDPSALADFECVGREPE